jgi:UDP-N-acetylmuramate dehydrogenase
MIIRIDEPLARHTAWRTGGRCGAWVVVDSVAELASVTAECRSADWKWTLVGHGTRTVWRDAEIPGAVIRLGGSFGAIDPDEGGWRVGAAVPMPALIACTAAAGRTGLEELAAVPGSVGASLALDSGWEPRVSQVEVLHRGKAVRMPLAEARAAKRTILSAELELAADRPEAVRRRIDKVLGARTRSDTPASSWYGPTRLPLRDVFASVQLPRVRLREVAIPDTAPEMLVNLGGGTAADLALLQRSAQERVKSTRGLELDSRVLWQGGA